MVGSSTRRLLTISECASQLGISRSKLYQEIGLGRIESVRIGRARRILIEELDTYVQLLLNEARAENAWPDSDDGSPHIGDRR